MDWETPPAVFEPLDAEFHFTLDVCATAENAKCARYFTEEEDGLAQDWDGVCWMNPPYGTAIAKWMKKAYEESRKGAAVVCLVPSRTDTRWWHEYAMQADEIRYIRGRIKFIGAENGAPFPSAVVVFRGEGWAQFARSDAQQERIMCWGSTGNIHSVRFDAVLCEPAADVASVKHGKWEYEHGAWQCSNCGKDNPYGIDYDTARFSKYCPNCGAKMDGEAEP